MEEVIEEHDDPHHLARVEDENTLEKRFQGIDKRITSEVHIFKKDIGAMSGKIENLAAAIKSLPRERRDQGNTPPPTGRWKKGGFSMRWRVMGSFHLGGH